MRVDLHGRVAEARVAGDADDRMPLIRRLRSDAVLHRRRDADRVADIRTDGAVLVSAVHDLAGPIAAQPAAHVAGDAVAARGDRRLLLAAACRDRGSRRVPWRSPPDARRRCSRARSCSTRAFWSSNFLRAAAISAIQASCVHRRHRVGERLERRPLAADDADVDRQVAADVLGRLIDADVARVGTERELADRRHAVLADQHHDVGAGQRAGAALADSGLASENCPFIAPDSTTGICAFSAKRFSASQARRRRRRCSTR